MVIRFLIILEIETPLSYLPDRRREMGSFFDRVPRRLYQEKESDTVKERIHSKVQKEDFLLGQIDEFSQAHVNFSICFCNSAISCLELLFISVTCSEIRSSSVSISLLTVSSITFSCKRLSIRSRRPTTCG